jgi:hypothetical protein
MPTPKSTTKKWEFQPVSISAASAIPERSAPMLIVFAAASARHTTTRLQRGNFCRRAPARPIPVTMPMRAHIIWTAAMSGNVSHAVQRSAVPSCAPAIE